MPRLLKNWLYAFRDWTIPRSEAQESLIIWSGLFTLASVAKRHVYFPRSLMGSYEIFPNLYVIFVGPSSVIKKSTTVGYGEQLLQQIESINIAPSGTSSSMLIGKMAETVDGSMTIISSEFGTFIQTSQEDMYDILSDLYDGKIKHDYETRAHGAEYISHPCLNLFAATTPDWLQDQPLYVVGGGFSARTIYVHETTTRKRQLYYNLHWPDFAKLEKDLAHDLQYIGKLEGEFQHDNKETADEMEEWYQTTVDIEIQARLVAFRNRKHVHVHKVAMLLSLAERDDRVLTMTHFKAAIALVDNIELKLPGIFSAIGKNPFGGDMEAVRDYMRNNPGKVEFQRIHRRFWQDIPGEAKLKELLGEMVTLGWLERTKKDGVKGEFFAFKG